MRTTSLLILALLIHGCTAAHGTASVETPPQLIVVVPPHPSLPPAIVLPVASGLESCLADGGALGVAAAVNNNDTRDHGELLAFAVSPAGELVTSAVDGVLKIWTLEGFVGELQTTVLTYGPESNGVPAADMVFHGDSVLLGDVGGLVTEWTLDGAMSVLSGTQPGISMTAVAIDGAHERFAHAEAAEHGRVMVRDFDASGIVIGPLATTIDVVTDLAFNANGSLLVAGADATGGHLELFSIVDGVASLTASHRAHDASSFDELALQENVAVAIQGSTLHILDAATLGPRHHAALGAVSAHSVELTSTGAYAIVLLQDGAIRVFDTVTGSEVSRVDAVGTASVSIRRDASDRFLFAADAGGIIRALSCTR